MPIKINKRVKKIKYSPDGVKINKGYRVAPSTITNAGLGLFATRDLPADHCLGRYKGAWLTVKNYDTIPDHLRAYVWAITDYRGNRDRHARGINFDPERVLGFIDGRNPVHANYLRYANHPLTKEMENIVAQQYGGRIYYYTLREIKSGEELFVNYGPEYSKILLGYEV